MSSSNSFSISITRWSSAHDVRFLKAYAASLTLSLSVVGKDCKTSYGHRCHIHSEVSLCIGSMNSFLTCWWKMLVQPSRSSTLSVVPSAHNFSRIGARVGGGGPCMRDGAPASTAFLKLRSVCFRRIGWRALFSAIDNLFLLGGSFSQRRSTPSPRTSNHIGSCCFGPAFPTLRSSPCDG